MPTKTTIVVLVILTLVGLALSLLVYPTLPEMVPSHWNAAGEVDDTMSRNTITFLIPGFTLVLGLVLLYLPNIDPLRANVERFRRVYNLFIVGFAAYLIFIHVLILLAGLGVEFNMTYLLIPPASLMMFGIGFVLEKTKPNWFLGVRTPWTLSSPDVWEKTHRLGSLLFKVSGGIMLFGLIVSADVAFTIMIGAILLTTIVLIFYSYFAYRAEKRR
jgi:uncharacterized membrane protein